MRQRSRRRSSWRWLIIDPPVRPIVALIAAFALLLTLPRVVAEGIARLDVAVLGLVALIALVGCIGTRIRGTFGRASATVASALLVTAATSLVTALPAAGYVDRICADGCVAPWGLGAVSTGPVLEAWFVTGLANLAPMVVGVWVATRVDRWLLGPDAIDEARHPHAGPDAIGNRVAAGTYRTQRHNARTVLGMRTPTFPWRR